MRSIVREQLGGVVGNTLAKAMIGTASKQVKKIKRKTKNKQISRVGSTNLVNNRSTLSGKNLILGKAANDWLNSYFHPFHQRVKGIGTPRPGSMPSFKITVFTRGTGKIGQQGVGYVYAMPCLASDRAVMAVTTSAYNYDKLAQFGNDISVFTQTGNTFSPRSVYIPSIPYVNATLDSSDVEGRIVSCSLRMRYTGTELNRSGNFYCYVDPDFRQIIGGSHTSTSAPAVEGWSVDVMSSMDSAEIFPVNNRTEARIVWIPPESNMYDYPVTNATTLRKVYPFSNAQAQFDSATSSSAGAIMITGVAGETFYYEYVQHMEYTGRLVPQSQLTESYSDILGFDTLQCALTRGQRNAAANEGGVTKSIRKELKAQGIQYREYK